MTDGIKLSATADSIIIIEEENRYKNVIYSFDYLGSFVYTVNNNIRTFESTSFGGGRINKTNNAYDINYFITDHLGSTRVIADNAGIIKEQKDYYPFGKEHENPNLISSTNRYTFSGKEKQTVGDLGWLDFMARMYSNSEIPIFTTQDPLSEKYYSISPYAYCAGNPVNAIDREGKAIVFINGMDWEYIESTKNLPNYWRGFDREVMRRFNDNRVIYRDGSMGGMSGLLSGSLTHSFNSLPSIGANLSVGNRIEAGYEQGKMDAPVLINQLKKTDGVITESLRVVTHSMGAAYAKGYIKAILDYAKENPHICEGLQITEYDFAPFQPTKQKAVKGVLTYQFSHSKDWLAGDSKIDGAIYMDTSTDPNQTHYITDFWEQVRNLPEGRYRIENGQIIPQ